MRLREIFAEIVGPIMVLATMATAIALGVAEVAGRCGAPAHRIEPYPPAELRRCAFLLNAMADEMERRAPPAEASP